MAVDEAHNYFASADSLRERYILQRAGRAVKNGRKYKLGLCLELDQQALRPLAPTLLARNPLTVP
jgi:DNA helicase HerA-like ATPase